MQRRVCKYEFESNDKYRVGQINLHKFQMVANTYTKRNDNICFIRVIAYIHSSQDIVMFDKSTKIIEWSKQKEMPLLNYAARAIPLPTRVDRFLAKSHNMYSFT